MPTDQVVGARDVLRAIQQLRRQGLVRAISELEAVEPDLCEHLLEEITALHAEFSRISSTHKQVRKLDRRVQSLCVVLVQALRSGYQQLISGDTESEPPDVDPPPPDELQPKGDA